ncbi:hypothetical protein BRADI_2g07437v3 [Brachypodium distachyon]|uniref:G domain-containing protein n=1 Tax=Brachypodium distachyon TaxID=15368 RepID=A0A2K2D7F6_BRADI|nr:hypothetical protein BRADI_2g07437v3 [Brachypodium distachyon]
MAAAAVLLRAALRRSRIVAPALLRPRTLPPSPIPLPSPPFGHALPRLQRLPFSADFGYCTAAVEPEAPARHKVKIRKSPMKQSRVDFTKVDAALLPTIILVGRPNVGKSALFNRLIRRREALVYNTPGDHVTRDIREGIAKLGDLRFRVLDSAGLETAATSGSILARTADMTGNVLVRSQFAIFLIDVRDGLQPLDLEVGQWLRKHASGIHTIVAMNKSESLDEHGVLTSAAGEAHRLGFGDPVAISAETGLGMAELYEILRPLFEEYMFQLPNNGLNQDDPTSEAEANEGDESKLPLQLAIVGRPNVGKSTLLNALLQEQRVLVGPEAGLTRDSIRAEFQFDNRSVYLVDTAGWMERSGKEKGPSSLSVVQSRKNLMRAHIVALVLDAEKVMSRHSWKDSATQPKVKYFTQVKARPPTFVAFMTGKSQLSDTDTRFLTKSLKEDFNIGGIPIRILQRSIPRKAVAKSNIKKRGSTIIRMKTDKRTEVSDPSQS